MSDSILSVRHYSAGFKNDKGLLQAVDDVSFDLKKGSTLGIVGESGCGKSVTALSVMRLLPVPSGQYMGGEILFNGRDLLKITPDELTRIRGNRISMIFQEPMTALNPVQNTGRQISEVFEIHRPEMTKKEIEEESVKLLEQVGIPEPLLRLREYPHQLSGGMRQRVMIAIALACKPDILIADEPTTALDVTIQAQILELIEKLQKETGMSVIFITHDLGVIAGLCDDVVVMYAGRVAEKATVHKLFENPCHPYTQGLLASIPRLDSPRKQKLSSIEGIVPSIGEYPLGCRFQNRCPRVFDRCLKENPPVTEIGENHTLLCHLYGDKNEI